MTTTVGVINSAKVAALSGLELKSAVRLFIGDASLELAVAEAGTVATLAGLMKQGAAVHVPHGPETTLDDLVRVSIALRDVGLAACPHLVVRRLGSEQALRHFLARLQAGGIDSILLTAGDGPACAGPFSSAVDVLNCGATLDHGMRRIGVVGHPEGSRSIAETDVWEALQQKQAFAAGTGTSLYIVTQFALNPGAVPAWERQLGTRGINLPIHVGLPGSNSLPHLMHHALQCGVDHSSLALLRPAHESAAAAGATTPDQVITGLVRQLASQPATRVVKPHFFSAGNAVETARWLQRAASGDFDMAPEDWRFTVRGTGAPLTGAS